MATKVPSQFQGAVNAAAKGTGIPADVVAAQANQESGFNANAVSSAGAEGWLQFLPSTYDAYAPSVGVNAGTEFNVTDETKVYIAYMNDLLNKEGGSVFKALEAYNAGPGNLPAGADYANSILSDAGEPQSLTASAPASTTGIDWNIFGDVSNALGSAENNLYSGIGSSILSGLGLGSVKDLLQRLGLMLLGVAILLAGIHMLSEGKSTTTIVDTAKGYSKTPAKAVPVE